VGLRQIGVVIALKMKAVMNIRNVWKLAFVAMLTGSLVSAPRAIADDINPDADVPDSSTLADSSPPNQVLEIPQQCDQASVAVLCDRSSDDSSPSPGASADAANGGASDSNDLANNPDPGSVYDYANQNITNEASAAGTMNVPMGVYVPGYPVLSSAPRIVSSGPIGPGSYRQWAGGPGSYQQWAGGPGSYQQWAAGPGSYQQMAPGPGYVQPLPLGYRSYGLGGGFGPRLFGGVGEGHFGRR
jgi:hypothetical protein